MTGGLTAPLTPAAPVRQIPRQRGALAVGMGPGPLIALVLLLILWIGLQALRWAAKTL